MGTIIVQGNIDTALLFAPSNPLDAIDSFTTGAQGSETFVQLVLRSGTTLRYIGSDLSVQDVGGVLTPATGNVTRFELIANGGVAAFAQPSGQLAFADVQTGLFYNTFLGLGLSVDDTVLPFEGQSFLGARLVGSDLADGITSVAGGDTLLGLGGSDELIFQAYDVAQNFFLARGGEIDGGSETDVLAITLPLGAQSALANLTGTTITSIEFLRIESGVVAVFDADDMRGAGFGAAATITVQAGAGLQINLFAPGTMDLTTLTYFDSGQGEIVVVGSSSSTIGDRLVATSAMATDIRASLGNDTLIGSARADTLDGEADNDLIQGGFGADVLLGRDGNDRIEAGGGAGDQLSGGAGSDTLVGDGGGGDTLGGNHGDDRYVVLRATDTILEQAGGGRDTVRSSVAYTLGTHLENAEAAGTAAIALTGNTVSNRLTGNDAVNAISALAGADTVIGAGGNDLLTGGIGTDSLQGDEGNDTLVGGADADTMHGGNGADRLNGQTGDDTLTGGGGVDRFVFATGDGRDRVVDFDAVGVVHDVLDLQGVAAITGFADLKANHLSSVAGNAVITVGVQTITLAGVAVSSLDAGDFLF